MKGGVHALYVLNKHSDIQYLVSQINTQRPEIEKHENFYHGQTKITFMGSQLQHGYGRYLESLSVNRCGIVADAIANKLKIRSWEDGDGESLADEYANERWQDIEHIADQVHADVVITGNGWLLAWPNADNQIEVGAQDPSQIAVRFNDENPSQIDVAAKTWQRADGTWRLNLYYADRLEKYVTNGPQGEPQANDAVWSQYSDDGDHSWPVQHNLGRVPIWHFKTNGRPGQLGISSLAAIVPLQERLNLDLAAQAVAVEHQAYAQRWVTGVQVEFEIIKDDEGKVIEERPINPFQNGADAAYIAPDSDARFGAFPAADLDNFEKLLLGDELRIARTARIPLHHVLGAGDVSGEAIKSSESSFVDMVIANQKQLGLVWSNAMQTILHHERGVPIDQRLFPRWISAASRDESEHIKRTLNKIAIGISPQQGMRELNYSKPQIDLFAEETEEWQRARQRLINEGLPQ